TLQRRDAQGDWNLISTPVIDDSLLVCEQNEGANLTVTDWPHIDDGLYYEVRLKANATTSTNTAKTSRLISTDGRTHRELPLPSPCALLKGMYGSPLSPIRQAKRASSS
ncbi:MAG: hypothetical protein FJY85_19660, partial [Deltaproteobacteria bacterium]|nr:hypothetical protein [Deltaproteobacteria bacterium]